MNIQASGKAIDITIAALDRINKEIPLTAMRPVIIHSQFPSEQNMKDAARIGIVLAVLDRDILTVTLGPDQGDQSTRNARRGQGSLRKPREHPLEENRDETP